jgi:hypothetical protein
VAAGRASLGSKAVFCEGNGMVGRPSPRLSRYSGLRAPLPHGSIRITSPDWPAIWRMSDKRVGPMQKNVADRVAATVAGVPIAAIVLLSLSMPAAAQCTTGTPTPIVETWKPAKTKTNGAEITIYTGPTDRGAQLQIAAGIDKSLWVASTSALRDTKRGFEAGGDRGKRQCHVLYRMEYRMRRFYREVGRYH